jgi:hypothetical protein
MKSIFSLLLCIALYTPTFAATWYVATNGNDNNPGTLSSPFKTLTAAIEAANPWRRNPAARRQLHQPGNPHQQKRSAHQVLPRRMGRHHSRNQC